MVGKNKTVYVYVEGGFSGRLATECRKGFRLFLEKAKFKRMPKIVACGRRNEAYRQFKIAVSQKKMALLLVDSEDAVKSGFSPWNHLTNRQDGGFIKPNSATDEDCHLMVVCMESWFLADKETLSTFFGQGFNEKDLPQNPKIEDISKQDVLSGLKRATAHCKTKSPYDKGEHSFKILGAISPEKVFAASPWAKRFLDTLHGVMNG